MVIWVYTVAWEVYNLESHGLDNELQSAINNFLLCRSSD